MSARHLSRILTLASIVIGVLAIPMAAHAYAPSGDDFITCVAGGDTNVECTAGVFDPGSEVDVLVETNPVLLDTTVTADADGVISFSFDVPDGTPAGDITVTTTGTLDGEAKVLSDAIAVINDDGSVIANAGSNATTLALAALAAIVVGGGALYISRRNKSDVSV